MNQFVYLKNNSSFSEMSSSYEERLSISIGAVKDMIRKIRKILEGVAKHTNIYIPKSIKDLIIKIALIDEKNSKHLK